MRTNAMTAPDSPVAARKNRRLPTLTSTTPSTSTTTTENKARDNKDDPVHGRRSRHPRTNPFQSHKHSFLDKWTRKGSKGSPLGAPRWATGIPILLLPMIVVLFWKSRDPRIRAHEAADDFRRSPKHPSPLVCSHQLLNPPVLPADPQRPAPHGKSQPPPDGSLDAMSALWHTGGVTCFDIDVVVLSDGNMLASHPRRLGAAIAAASRENRNPTAADADADAAAALSLEEHTLESIQKLLGLRRYGTDRDPTNLRSSGSHDRGGNDASSCPFPLFDEEVLPRFAGLVRGIPGAFSPAATTTIATPSLQPPWALRGPLLNIDLKLGPYLTESRVLDLVKQIALLGLEEHVAICVTAPPPTSDKNKDNKKNEDKTGHDSSLDLLEVMHRYNTEGRTKAGGDRESNPAIPLGLVLRDRVPEDASVDRVRRVVEELYPESIRAMVPSFRFSEDWYRAIRHRGGEDRDTAAGREETALWKLPMTVWTIDSREDYRYVASLKTTSDGGEHGGIPFASAVVANKPMELLE